MDQAGLHIELVRTETDELRHKVLNDYNAVIACIVQESASTENMEVKAALSRVADCVYQLASSLRVDA